MIIDFQNVDLRYEDAYVLKNISLNIQEAQHTVILGANGSGKSTLIKLINCELYPSYKNERLNPLQIRQTLSKLQRKRLEESFKTDRAHVENLKERHNARASNTEILTCKRCGSAMILRQNKKNGEEFYGCSNYPKCRHTAPIA